MDSTRKDIASLRQEYSLASLLETGVHADPIEQFRLWFQEAVEAEIDDVNAMTLSTLDENAKPHSRIVLLKGLEESQFVFFTNYHSHKGREISQNSHVSLVFYWKELQRQVRIEGKAEKISDEESTTYFHARPKESQIGAWASAQSEVLSGREELDARFKTLLEKYQDTEVPKPPHWGGYAVKPTLIEFWQGRSSRLHDRLCFTELPNGQWEMNRLNP